MENDIIIEKNISYVNNKIINKYIKSLRNNENNVWNITNIKKLITNIINSCNISNNSNNNSNNNNNNNSNNNNNINSENGVHIIELLPILFDRLLSDDINITKDDINEDIFEFIYNIINKIFERNWNSNIIQNIIEILLQLPLLPMHWIILHERIIEIIVLSTNMTINYVNKCEKEDEKQWCVCDIPTYYKLYQISTLQINDWAIFAKLLLNILKQCIERCSSSSLYELINLYPQYQTQANALECAISSYHSQIWINTLRILLRYIPTTALPNVIFVIEVTLQQSPELCQYILTNLFSHKPLLIPHLHRTCMYDDRHMNNHQYCGHAQHHSDLTLILLIRSALRVHNQARNLMGVFYDAPLLLHLYYIEDHKLQNNTNHEDITYLFKLWEQVCNIEGFESRAKVILDIILPWIDIETVKLVDHEEFSHDIQMQIQNVAFYVMRYMFKTWYNCRDGILECILSGIATEGNTDLQVSFAYLLESMMLEVPSLLISYCSRFEAWFTYTSQFPFEVAYITLRGLIHLCAIHRTFFNRFVIMLRKLASSRDKSSHMLAIYGLVHLLVKLLGIPLQSLEHFNYSLPNLNVPKCLTLSGGLISLTSSQIHSRPNYTDTTLTSEVIHLVCSFKRYSLIKKRRIYKVLVSLFNDFVSLNVSDAKTIEEFHNLFYEMFERCLMCIDENNEKYSPIICISNILQHEGDILQPTDHISLLILGLWYLESIKLSTTLSTSFDKPSFSLSKIIESFNIQLTSPFHLLYLLEARELSDDVDNESHDTDEDVNSKEAEKQEVSDWFDNNAFLSNMNELYNMMNEDYLNSYINIQTLSNETTCAEYKMAMNYVLKSNKSGYSTAVIDNTFNVLASLSSALTIILLHNNSLESGILMLELASIWRLICTSKLKSIEIDPDIDEYFSLNSCRYLLQHFVDSLIGRIDNTSNILSNDDTTILPSWSSLSLISVQNLLRILGIKIKQWYQRINNNDIDSSHVVLTFEVLYRLFCVTEIEGDLSYEKLEELLTIQQQLDRQHPNQNGNEHNKSDDNNPKRLLLKFINQPIIDAIFENMINHSTLLTVRNHLTYMKRFIEKDADYFELLFDIRCLILEQLCQLTDIWLQLNLSNGCQFSTLLQLIDNGDIMNQGKTLKHLKKFQETLGDDFNKASTCEVFAYFITKWLYKEISIGIPITQLTAYVKLIDSSLKCCTSTTSKRMLVPIKNNMHYDQNHNNSNINHLINHSNDNNNIAKLNGINNIQTPKDIKCYCHQMNNENSAKSYDRWSYYWLQYWPIQTETTYAMLSIASMIRQILINERITHVTVIRLLLSTINKYSGVVCGLNFACTIIDIILASKEIRQKYKRKRRRTRFDDVDYYDSSSYDDDDDDDNDNEVYENEEKNNILMNNITSNRKKIIKNLKIHHLYPPTCIVTSVKHMKDDKFLKVETMPMKIALDNNCKVTSLLVALTSLNSLILRAQYCLKHSTQIKLNTIRGYMLSNQMKQCQEIKQLSVDMCEEVLMISYILIPVASYCNMLVMKSSNNSYMKNIGSKLSVLLRNLLNTSCSFAIMMRQFIFLILKSSYRNWKQECLVNEKRRKELTKLQRLRMLEKQKRREKNKRRKELARRRKNAEVLLKSGDAFFKVAVDYDNDDDKKKNEQDDKNDDSDWEFEDDDESESDIDDELDDHINLNNYHSNTITKEMIPHLQFDIAIFNGLTEVLYLCETTAKWQSSNNNNKKISSNNKQKMSMAKSKIKYNIERFIKSIERLAEPLAFTRQEKSKPVYIQVKVGATEQKTSCHYIPIECVLEKLYSTRKNISVVEMTTKSDVSVYRRRNKRMRLRSRNAWIDRNLQEDRIYDDDYRDLEDFIVVG